MSQMGLSAESRMKNYAKDENQTRCCQALQKDRNREIYV
jgi:hypothetical protein